MKITRPIRHFSPLLLALAASAPAAELRNAPQESFWITDGPVYASALDANTVYLGGVFTKLGRFTGGLTALATTNDAILGRPLSDSAWPVVDGEVFTVIGDGSGGWFIGGEFTRVGSHTTRNLAHLLASGAVDTAFVSTIPNTWYGLALASGKLYGADGYYYGSALSVINAASGASLPNITLSGIGGAYALAVDGSKLYIARSNGVARVETATNTLEGFTVTTNNAVNALVVSGGTLYLGGAFTTVGSTARKGLAAVSTTDGALNASWNPALSTSGVATSLLLDGGTLYVGGAFTTLGTAVQANLGRVDLATGAADSTWAPLVTGRVEALALDSTTLYVGGALTAVGGTATTGVGAVSTTTAASSGYAPVLADLGTYRTLFGDSLVHTLGFGGGRLLVGGIQELGGGVIRNSAAALDLATGQATAWNPDLSNGNASTSDDAVQSLIVSGGNVILGGDFSQVGGVARTRLAKVSVSGTLDSAFTPAANGSVKALAAASDGTVYVGGSFTSLAGTTRNRVGALSASGALISAFNPNANGEVNALLLDGSTLTLGGSFSQVTTTTRRGLARVATADGALQTWDPNSASTTFPTIATLAKLGNTLYFGGSFSKVSSFDRSNLGAVAFDTGSITAWDPGANSSVSALALSDTSLLIGGSFTAIGGATRNGKTALVDAIGTTSAWNPSLNGSTIRTTVPLADGRQLVGGNLTSQYLTSGFNSRTGIAVFGANTAPTANAGTLTVLEDAAPTTVTVTGSDGEGDALTWRLGAITPSKGTVTVSAAGVCSYRPSANASGSDTFTVIANDGSLDSAPALITVTITPVNDAPVANGSSFSVVAGATVDGILTATDVDGDTLSFAVVTNPATGTLTVNPATGAFTYVAPASGATSASFTYRVTDGTIDSAIATVSLAITAATGYPTVSLTEPVNNAFYAKGSSLQLTAAAADSDGTVASVVFKQGTTTLATDTNAPWQTTVPLNTSGTFTFTAVATDNSSKSTSSAGVTITVIDAPTVTITSPANSASFPAPGTIEVAAGATAGSPATVVRIDFLLDNVLTATDSTAPYQASLPNVTAGSHVITARVLDSKGLSASTSVNIQVAGRVTPPPTPNPAQDDAGGGGGCGLGSGLAVLMGALTCALGWMGRWQKRRD